MIGDAMISLKQIEALVWVSRLGTFERAAKRLNTAQSTLSKRVKELELASDITLFDRVGRNTRLTPKGEAMVAIASEMLALVEQVKDLRDDREYPERQLGIGITELCAQTWLPKLVNTLQASHPRLIQELAVDHSQVLLDRLDEGNLDVIVRPAIEAPPPGITSLPIGSARMAWMANRQLGDWSRPYRLSELSAFTVITQGTQSGNFNFFRRYFQLADLSFDRVLKTDSLSALIGMTIAGVGISYLPRDCLMPLVAEGSLCEIAVEGETPEIDYYAFYRDKDRSGLVAEIARQMKEICDFTQMFKASTPG